LALGPSPASSVRLACLTNLVTSRFDGDDHLFGAARAGINLDPGSPRIADLIAPPTGALGSIGDHVDVDVVECQLRPLSVRKAGSYRNLAPVVPDEAARRCGSCLSPGIR